MTIKVYQHPFGPNFDETRRGNDSRADQKYYITGTSLYIEARTALLTHLGAAGLSLEALVLHKIRIFQTGSELWEADLDYSDLITSQRRWSIDTTGNTARVTHGYSEFRYGPAGLNDPNVPPMSGALSVIDGKVEGTEIPIPGLKFSVTRAVPRWFVTDAYVQVIENLTGSTNLAAYEGRPPQSLLFLGATGGQQAKGNPEFTYQFVSGQYRTLAIGDITNIEKKPHQYMWPDWADDDDATSMRLRKRCRGVYVNDVFPVFDWTQLTPPAEDAEEP